MNEIVKVFNARPVRIMTLDGEQWFVGKDVCNLLGYKDSTKAIKLHCYGGAKYHPIQTAGGMQKIGRTDVGDILAIREVHRPPQSHDQDGHHSMTVRDTVGRQPNDHAQRTPAHFTGSPRP